MRNGNPLPRHLYSLLVSQDFTYNTNVITQADEALLQVSNADAVEWKTGFLAKYQLPMEQTLQLYPRARRHGLLLLPAQHPERLPKRQCLALSSSPHQIRALERRQSRNPPGGSLL